MNFPNSRWKRPPSSHVFVETASGPILEIRLAPSIVAEAGRSDARGKEQDQMKLSRCGHAAAAVVACCLFTGGNAYAGGGAGGADVQVSGSASTGSPSAGAAYTYTFQIKNSGSDSANLVTFLDTLPAGTGLNYAYVSFPGSASPCSTQNMVVACNIGTMLKGSQASVVIGLDAPVTAGAYGNTGTASSSSPDPQPSNNSSTVTVQVKTALAPCPVTLGQTTMNGMIMWMTYLALPSGTVPGDFELQVNGVNYDVMTNYYDGSSPLTQVINLDCKQSPVQFVAVGNFVNVTGTVDMEMVGSTLTPVIHASAVQVMTHKDAI
jgi:uncharacterized repeat protein (TIGR01451 family)